MNLKNNFWILKIKISEIICKDLHLNHWKQINSYSILGL